MFVTLHFMADLFSFADWSQGWYSKQNEEAQACTSIFREIPHIFVFPQYAADIV